MKTDVLLLVTMTKLWSTAFTCCCSTDEANTGGNCIIDEIIGPVSTCCNWLAWIADAGTWMVSTRGSEFGTFGWGGSVIWIGTIFDGSKPATTAGGAGGVCVWGCTVDCCVWLGWVNGLWVPFVWLAAFALFSVVFCCCDACCCWDCNCCFWNLENSAFYTMKVIAKYFHYLLLLLRLRPIFRFCPIWLYEKRKYFSSIDYVNDVNKPIFLPLS